MKRLKRWYAGKLLAWASRIIQNYGFTVAKIENVAGTNYILDTDGTRHRIGGKKK